MSANSLVLLIVSCALVIMSASRAIAATWSPETQVNVGDSSADWNPMVVCDSAGLAWVFWMGIDPSQGDFEIYYSRWSGDGWTPEERVHEDNLQKDAWPVACIGRDGIPWVAWERHRGGTSPDWDVLITHWSGAGWAPVETLYAARGWGGEGQTYEIAVVDTNLVWGVISAYVKRGTAYDTDLFFRSRQGGVWSALEQIDHPVIYDAYPDIAVSSAGVPWATWEAWDHIDTLHCMYRDETGWKEPVLTIKGYAPRMCFSRGEGPWIAYFGDTSQICTAFWDGNSWSFSGPIPLPHVIPSEWDYRPMISGNERWGPVIAWPREDHNNARRGDVYASRWTGCWWKGEELVTEPDSELVALDAWPDVSVGPGGRVWVVWERYNDIWARYSDDFVTEPWVKGFGALVEGGSVAVEWQCRGRVRLNLYRADMGGCGGPEVQGERELVYTVEPLAYIESFVDSTVEAGRRYRYWLEVVSPTGVTCEEAGPLLVKACEGGVRIGFVGVRPNPSGAGFMLGYYVGQGEAGKFEVMDISGRLVRRIECPGTEGEVLWDGRDERGKEVSPGVYLARLLVGGRAARQVYKLVLLR